jgi:predicted amidophosphoribosyltransferase
MHALLMRETLKALADLVLSSQCLMCAGAAEQLGEAVCGSCRSLRQVPAQDISRDPLVLAVRPYDRVSQHVILNVKEHDRRALEPVLAEAIAIAGLPLVQSTHAPVVLVPVPSRAAARRRRGADVIWSVTRRSARLLAAAGWPVSAERLLTHTRVIADQSGLTATERVMNIHGSMSMRIGKTPLWFGRFTLVEARPPSIMGERKVIVVDDLVTTGATMREAIRALHEGSGRSGVVVGGVCAASTALRTNRR